MEEEQQENRNENQQDNIIEESKSTAVDSRLQLTQSYEYDHQQAAAGMEDIRGKFKSPAMYPRLEQGPSQRMEDIRGKTISPAMYYSQVLQRGHSSYEYAQGMENIRGKLKSPAAMYSQVPAGFGQGIEDIRGKLKSPAMHPADEPQQVPRFGSGQGIQNIRGKLISPAMHPAETQKVPRFGSGQGIENIRGKLISPAMYPQLPQQVGYRQPLERSADQQERMQDIDVIDNITSYSYDVLKAVEYEYVQDIDNVLFDERPEVLELVVYFNHSDVNKIRLKAEKEIVLLKEESNSFYGRTKQEIDDIEKLPHIHIVDGKIKNLQAVVRICNAEQRSKKYKKHV